MSVFNLAAIKIQQHYRGRLFRNKLRELKKKIKIISPKKATRTLLDKYMTFLDENRYGSLKVRPPWIDGGYSSWCAVKIQSAWRKFPIRRRYLRSKRLINQVASIVIQTFWRNFHEKPAKKKLNALAAVHIIVLAWRTFCNKRVFRYFRDLIKKKLKGGTPTDLLRTIIPNEANELMDKAAGVHVRFRLGGIIFPPKLYFKIYTHKPVCDVGAFAPRNYKGGVGAGTHFNKTDPLQLHNNFSSINLFSKSLDVGSIRVGTKYFDTVVSAAAGGTENWSCLHPSLIILFLFIFLYLFICSRKFFTLI
jgi:hypothetical protein